METNQNATLTTGTAESVILSIFMRLSLEKIASGEQSVIISLDIRAQLTYQL